MLMSGIASTTKKDSNNLQITKESLEQLAYDINYGDKAIRLNVEHDLSVLPIGKILEAHVEKIDTTNYGLWVKIEQFPLVNITFNNQPCVFLKSSLDNRPFVSNTIIPNDKFLVQFDPVNFKSFEESQKHLQKLKRKFPAMESTYTSRNSVIPDPVLMFHIAEYFIKNLVICFLCKKTAEQITSHIVDKALQEVDSLYNAIKKIILSTAPKLIPHNRPVTYLFTTHHNCDIEFVVQTSKPTIAINAIQKEKLLLALEEIERINACLSNITTLQLIYNISNEKWEFNYLTTDKGEVIGSQRSFKTSVRKISLLLPESDNNTIPISIGANISNYMPTEKAHENGDRNIDVSSQ